MKGDWIVLAHNNCDELQNVQLHCDAERGDFLGTEKAFTFIDETDLEAKQDSLTIVRMVGEITTHLSVLFTGGTGGIPHGLAIMVTLDQGIYLAGEDPDGNATELIPSVDPDVQLDNWLWLRRATLVAECPPVAANGVVFNNGAFDADPGPMTDRHVDLRAKRRMRRGQSLVYTQTVFWQNVGFGIDNPVLGTNFTAVVGLNFQMRGYVKF